MNTYIYNIFIFNFKTNIMKKTKAFTMVEILIISILLWAWLVLIFQAAHDAKMTNEKVSQSIIANQIATEWVELLYQFRNTNFLKHEWQDLNWQKEWSNVGHRSWNKCRLALDYTQSMETCNERLWSWYYYIETNNWVTKIVECDNCNNSIWEDILTGNLAAVNTIDNKYAICLKDWVWTPCPNWHAAWWDESKYWKFYRTIYGLWIYDMSSQETWGKLIISDVDAESKDAQEYRFCSIVARKGWQGWVVEICTTMTNFIE